MNRWRGLSIEAEGTGISRELSLQINLLGEMLGQVIREEAGDELFELVEELRSRVGNRALLHALKRPTIRLGCQLSSRNEEGPDEPVAWLEYRGRGDGDLARAVAPDQPAG